MVKVSDLMAEFLKEQNIKTLINVVKSSKDYTNKQIKQLIHDLKYKLPF